MAMPEGADKNNAETILHVAIRYSQVSPTKLRICAMHEANTALLDVLADNSVI